MHDIEWSARQFKRFLRKTGQSHPLRVAFSKGQYAKWWGRGVNHYPPGRRHDQWDRGFVAPLQ